MLFGRKDQESAWRSRFPEQATCVRCLEEKDLDGMDRLLWCEDCRGAARRRAGAWGWVAGAAFAAALALWIWVYQKPSDLVIGGWVAVVVAALYLGARIAREIAYGAMRFTNRKAAAAVPPAQNGP